MRRPIEDDSALMARLKEHVQGGQYSSAIGLLKNHDITIRQTTIDALGERFASEVAIMIPGHEQQIGQKVIVPQIVLQPSIRGHARATYAFRHWDMLEDFARAVDVLSRHHRSVTRSDASPEFYAWAERELTRPEFARRVAELIDFTNTTEN